MKRSKRIFTCVLTMLLAVYMVTGCGGAESRKAKYLERGKNYIEQNNYDKAIVELRNVLQIDPKHAEAYYLSGLAEEKKLNWQRAFLNYSKAVELDPDNIEAQVSVGRFYLFAKEIKKSEEISQAVLSKKPEYPEGLMLKGAIMFAKKDVSGAVKLAHDIVSKNPTQVEAVVLLAHIYRQEGHLDKAQEVLEKGIVTNPKSTGLRIQLSRLYMNMKKPDKAEEQLQAITSIEPKNIQHKESLAVFYRQTKQLDKAENIFREIIKENPDDAHYHLLFADFLANEKGKKPAEEQLLADIQKHPKMYELRFSLAILYEYSDQPDLGAEQYRKIIDARGTDVLALTARVRLASLLLKQPGKTPDEPERLIDEVLEHNPRDNAALLMKGKVLLKQGKATDAVTAFRSILKDQPDSLEVLILLGSAHFMNKERGLAEENFKKAVELNPKSPKAHLAFAEFLAKTEDFDGALKSLDTVIKLAPKELDAYMAKAQLQAIKNDSKGIEKTLLTVQKVYPDRPIGFYRMGQFYVSQKKYDQALREFEHALKLAPAAGDPLSGIISMHIALGKPDKAVNRLNEILKSSPNHILAYKLLSEVYQQQKRYDDAEKALRRAVEISPAWNVPYISIAGLYFERKDAPNAFKVIEQGLQAIPDDPQLLLLLAGAYENSQAYDKAIDTYEHILKKHPDGIGAINNLASLLVDRKNDEKSLARAKTLALRLEKAPQPAIQDTVGWVYYKSGSLDKAIPILEAVVKQAPTVPIFHYHLGMAYHKKGNNADAKVHLTAALADKKNFIGVEEARATLQLIP